MPQRGLGASCGPAERRTRHHQRVAAGAVSLCQGMLVIIGNAAQLDGFERNSQRRRAPLRGLCLVDPCAVVKEDDPGDAGDGLR